tara:strand:+ start:101 stop:298 length:198 start_codon:yes stop_codon:yes gene_type:complete
MEHKKSDFKKVECVICEFVYDENKGLPHEGIDKGTKYEEMPYDWVCPECDKGTGGNFCSEATLED